MKILILVINIQRMPNLAMRSSICAQNVTSGDVNIICLIISRVRAPCNGVVLYSFCILMGCCFYFCLALEGLRDIEITLSVCHRDVRKMLMFFN